MERLSRLANLRSLAGTGGALRATWSTMPVNERRNIVQAVVDHVTVLAAEPPRQVFRPARLQPSWLE